MGWNPASNSEAGGHRGDGASKLAGIHRRCLVAAEVVGGDKVDRIHVTEEASRVKGGTVLVE